MHWVFGSGIGRSKLFYRSGVCRYDTITKYDHTDDKKGIIVKIGSFVRVLVPPDYDNETRVQQFAATDPWIEYIAWLEAVEIEPQQKPKCHLHWLKDRTDLQKREQVKKKDEDKEEDEENKWVTIVNHRGKAVSKDVPLRWVQGPVYDIVRANHTIIHKEGAFIDCVNCTECLLSGLAGLGTGLPDGEGHCHAVGSSECSEPIPETIIVSHEFDYMKIEFQNIANSQLFYAKDNLRRTLAYVTLDVCEVQQPLVVRLPIPNGPNYAICIHVSKFPCGLNIEVGGALEFTTQDKKGKKLGSWDRSSDMAREWHVVWNCYMQMRYKMWVRTTR